MNGTIKSMRKIVTTDDMKKSYNELVELYNSSNLFPSYLAATFLKLTKIIYDISSKYESFDEDDVYSIALDRVNYCMQHYDVDNKSGASFTTYFHSVFTSAMKTHYKYLVADMRILNTFNCDSIEYLEEEYGIEVGYVDQNSDVQELMDQIGLDEREQKLCKLLMSGYNQVEISRIFELSPPMVAHIKNRVKEKINGNIELFSNLAI